LWCAGETGKEYGVKVFDDKGVAIHSTPSRASTLALRGSQESPLVRVRRTTLAGPQSCQAVGDAGLVDRAENVVPLGPPGVGKTHPAIGLGVRALQGGHRVYFLTAQDLLDQIRIAQIDGIPGHKQRHLNTVPLLVIDELGYVEFDKSAATWLFQLICRYEHRSTIITSNKAFADWGSVFAHAVLATALVRRLRHHSHVLSLKGDNAFWTRRVQLPALLSRGK